MGGVSLVRDVPTSIKALPPKAPIDSTAGNRSLAKPYFAFPFPITSIARGNGNGNDLIIFSRPMILMLAARNDYALNHAAGLPRTDRDIASAFSRDVTDGSHDTWAAIE